MSDTKPDGIVDDITRRYVAAHPKSKVHAEAARRHLPGGVTRITTFFPPYPPYMERGQGCRLVDHDGNSYLDFLGNYTALVHGHAHPAIVAAVTAQAQKATIYGAASPLQYELADVICERVPSLAMLNFCSSGTEATMMAMRAARAVTGRPIVVKMDGGYHGSNDYGLVNFMPSADGGLRQGALPGVPAGVVDSMRVVPFNDLDAVEETLASHTDQIAAVMLEPLLGNGGGVLPQPGYLQGLRALTERYGVLLIFDEIVTLRLSRGGYQELSGVEPDLTTLGKIIGGGLSIGAFGGRRAIMERFDPAHPQVLYHTGTFYAQELTMAAGLAGLHVLTQSEIDRINALGGRLRAGFNQALQAQGLKGQAIGEGSLVMVHWTDAPLTAVSDAQRALKAAGALPRLLHLEMVNHGIYAAPRGMFCISTPMTEAEVDEAIRAFAATVEVLKPYIAATAPHLAVN
jgi:glutamate-1-semialdehyde 2,1-aminomutase